MSNRMSGRSATASTELLATASLDHTWNVATMRTPVGLYPKAGLLPAVVEVRDQTGNWDGVGQTRQLMLSDGGSVIEHTTNVDRLEFFAYNLSDFQKVFGVMVQSARQSGPSPRRRTAPSSAGATPSTRSRVIDCRSRRSSSSSGVRT